MKISVLSSGSSGNAFYIENEKNSQAILVDCGVSCKKIEERLREQGINGLHVRIRASGGHEGPNNPGPGAQAVVRTLSRDGLSAPEGLKNESGGLSGKPLTKRSTEVIRYLSE